MVRVSYATRDGDREAACYFKHDSVEDTALELANPLEAYATSPYRMTIDGRTLSRLELAETVKKAMVGQGKELLDRALQGIEDATGKVGGG